MRSPGSPVQFVGYLFVQHDQPDNWWPIRETPGVASVLKTGSRLQFVRPGEVEAVQASEEARRTIPAKPPWAPGMACMCNGHGPLRGQPGVAASVNGTAAVVSMLMLGELRRITLPIAQLGYLEAFEEGPALVPWRRSAGELG